ncbi:MAG TPA: protein-disulfide reductase DsbD domain-containing protein [Verrucomicrobiae bacterium]|jgi:thiol:disulfide interchange protein DsbD
MLTAFVTNRWWRAVLLAAFCAALSAGAAQSRIRLALSAQTAKPGDTIWAGLQIDMPPKWHVYWRNGGDAGIPPSINWNLPQGLSAGEIQWPVPEKEIDKTGDTALVTYIYTKQALLLVPIKLAADLPPGPVTLKAGVHWMECSEECVMAKGDAQATLEIGAETKPSASAALIEQWRKKVPQAAAPGAATAHWQTTTVISNARPVVIEWKNGAAPADFYPDASTNFSADGLTETLKSDAGVALAKRITTNGGDWPDHITGVLVSRAGLQGQEAVEVSLPIGPPQGAEKKAAAPLAAGALATMLLFAFLGGLILNVMPCVLPVIALKIFAFVKQSGETPGRVRNLGLVYGVGVLVSFLILALLAIGAQEAGRLANWGDLLRIPNVQLGLAVLVTLIALNLFGVFEITLSSRAAGAADELASRSGFSGAFFNGVLATILATPCTAPFLGAALAFALAQSAGVIVLFFLTAGVGFACPFVALCAQPRWMAWLPKPGKWMERFKMAMGFPMLATAFWLMWVAASDQSSMLWLGLFLVVLALAAWMWGEFVQRSVRRKAISAALCVVLVALDFVFVLRGHTSEISNTPEIAWQPWSQQAVEAAQQAGHPVLVDMTAKSCLTCQINKASSIEIDSTRAKLKQIGAVTLIGDYTREDPAIGEILRRYGRSGVPLVLVYSKDASKPPEVLPTILTPSIVLKYLDEAAGRPMAVAKNQN